MAARCENPLRSSLRTQLHGANEDRRGMARPLIEWVRDFLDVVIK